MKDNTFLFVKTLKKAISAGFKAIGLVQGFTLTEVLMATAIVGIIAGLVLPTTISRAQNRGFEQAYDRNIKAISSAVDSLIVIENKDFFKTEMYLDEEPTSYEDSSGKFIKNYLKVSKYCGSSGTEAKKCFADNYYQYNEHKKESYTPDIKGACAILKNGASVCIVPQIGAGGVKGIIDLNGKKGPNIFGRDMREFVLAPKTRIGMDKTLSSVLVTTAPDLSMGASTNPCDNNPSSLECCKTKTITSSSDACCSFTEIYDATPACVPPPPDPCTTDPHGLACCQQQGVTDANKSWCCTFSELASNPACPMSTDSCSDGKPFYIKVKVLCYDADDNGNRVYYGGSTKAYCEPTLEFVGPHEGYCARDKFNDYRIFFNSQTGNSCKLGSKCEMPRSQANDWSRNGLYICGVISPLVGFTCSSSKKPDTYNRFFTMSVTLYLDECMYKLLGCGE